MSLHITRHSQILIPRRLFVLWLFIPPMIECDNNRIMHPIQVSHSAAWLSNVHAVPVQSFKSHGKCDKDTIGKGRSYLDKLCNTTVKGCCNSKSSIVHTHAFLILIHNPVDVPIEVSLPACLLDTLALFI